MTISSAYIRFVTARLIRTGLEKPKPPPGFRG